MKKSTTLTAEQKKQKKNDAAKAKRLAKKSTAVTLAEVVAEQTNNSYDTSVNFDMNDITSEEAAAAVAEETQPKVAVVRTRVSTKVQLTPEAAQLEARTFLGETAIVWSVTEDAKGKQFTAPRYRVGLPADKDTGYLIESGRKIVGAGNSYAEAVKDARTRTAAKSAEIAA